MSEELFPVTICDRCGASISTLEACAGIGPWQGGTLCNDCYADVEADLAPIAWQDLRVLLASLARNEAGQFAGVFHLADGLALSFVFERSGASWGWQPAEPQFIPNRTEEP